MINSVTIQLLYLLSWMWHVFCLTRHINVVPAEIEHIM